MLIERLLGEDRRAPDILECLSNLSSDEVFTPPPVAGRMLDLLPDEVWSNPDLKWLDPVCKTGIFLREAASRLMDGLAEVIEDEGERRSHIFHNMLYGIAITELTGHIARRSLYYSKDASGEYAVVPLATTQGNILQRRSEHKHPPKLKGVVESSRKCEICGTPDKLDREGLENYAYTFIHDDEVFDMKFDVIIGNPPYQLEDTGFGAAATPIYQHFVNQAKSLDPLYMLFIIPARWYAGGKRLTEFRDSMLSDPHIQQLVDYPDASELFPGVDIKGGICYFLRNRDHVGKCQVVNVVNGEALPLVERALDEHEVFIRFGRSVEILSKVQARGEESFDAVLSTREPFGFMSNFDGYERAERKGHLVYVMRGNNRAWVARSDVRKNVDWIDHWKVFLATASDGSGTYPQSVLGRPIVEGPGVVCSGTYLVAGVYDSEQEAQNCADYLRTRFARFMVSLQKNTQHLTQQKASYLPKLDMKQAWTDSDLFDRYELDDVDWEFIQDVIKEMAS